MSTHEIVVVGGNLAGVPVIHNLLRSTIPTLKKMEKSKYHVTLITPNTHLFFKIASPRTLTEPKAFPTEKIFRPLSEGFKSYTAEQLTIVQGIATALDPSKRSVSVELSTKATKDILYDTLILATGTTSPSPLWTLHGDESLSIRALKTLNEKLASAKTVLIAGGGAVGVETAGEIASNYPSTKITLLSGTDKLLARSLQATSARAQSFINDHYKNVEIIHDKIRITKTEPANAAKIVDERVGPTTLTLSNGSTRVVDIFIDATGGKVNSEYLPASWLDETKRVIVRGGDFRVKGSASDDVSGIYAVGDIVAGNPDLALILDAQIASMLSSIQVDIAGSLLGEKNGQPPSQGIVAAVLSFFFGNAKSPRQIPYKPMQNTIVVPIGRGGGVGEVFGWKMPSPLVSLAKGKNYLTEMIEPMLMGSKIKVVA